MGDNKPDLLKLLNGIKGAPEFYKRGQHLYQQGDSPDYFIVTNGWVALSAGSEDGACHITDLAVSGAVLGLVPPFRKVINQTAECLTPVHVLSFGREKFNSALERDSRLAGFLLSEATEQLARANDRLVNITCRRARERLAYWFAELFLRIHGALPSADDEQLTLPLTLQQIGEATGLTDVHVSRTLRVLRDDRVLSLKGKTLTIHDPNELLEMSGFSRHAM